MKTPDSKRLFPSFHHFYILSITEVRFPQSGYKLDPGVTGAQTAFCLQ